MADRPILYQGPMVRTQLEDRKGQTRRLPTRLTGFGKITEFGSSDTKGYDWHFRDKAGRWHDLKHNELMAVLPWHAGDRLWVKETYRFGRGYDGVKPRDVPGHLARVWYEADGEPSRHAGQKRVSIHMPRWASRMTDIVTDVRVQQLQEISEDDARAEGACSADFATGREVLDPALGSYRLHYRQIWGDINGAGSWDANPWVVAISFRVVKRNIDK